MHFLIGRMENVEEITSFSDLPFSGEWLNLPLLRNLLSTTSSTTISAVDFSALQSLELNRNINLCVFHAPCSDGSAAAFVVSKFFGPQCSFYGVNRGSGDTDTYLPSGVEGSHVLLLDYVYSENLMRELIKIAESVTVIDHHVSELALLRKLGFSVLNLDHQDMLFSANSDTKRRLLGIYSSRVSACILTWKWLYPSDPIPMLLCYINDNDVGSWSLPNIGNFVAGFCVDSCVLRPGWSEWTDFKHFSDSVDAGSDFVRSRILIGMIAKQIEWRDVLAEAQRCADRRLKVAPNFLCRVLNISQTASSGLLFRSLLSGKYLYDDSWEPREPADIALHYYFIDSNGTWKCSLRSASQDVNVGEIASKLGGGGHACAASFTLYGDLDELFLPQNAQTPYNS